MKITENLVLLSFHTKTIELLKYTIVIARYFTL